MGVNNEGIKNNHNSDTLPYVFPAINEAIDLTRKKDAINVPMVLVLTPNDLA
jgi:hypothetical protein